LYYIPFLDLLKVKITRKDCSVQDLAGFEKVSPAIGKTARVMANPLGRDLLPIL